MKDDAWRAFQRELLTAMTGPPTITAKALAEALQDRFPAATEDVVANWRRGRSHPPLAQLGNVVDALAPLQRGQKRASMTIAQVLVAMGVVATVADTDLVDKALRLQKLESKIDFATSAAATLGRDSGAGIVAQTAVRSGRWAVAVWPALEGPDDLSLMHVADRIDIMRVSDSVTSSGPLEHGEVWRDPDMKAALRATRAMRAAAHPRVADRLIGPASWWSIPRLGTPRDAVLPDPWPKLTGSVCFIATTVDSWVHDLAAIVALQIGYGFTSVRDLAMEIYGVAPSVSPMSSHLDIHDQLLDRPPRRRVWSVTGGLGDTESDIEERIGRSIRGKTVYVTMVEDDASLHRGLRGETEGFVQLQVQRDSLSTLALRLPPEQHLTIPVEYRDTRRERWQQVFEQALKTLRFLEEKRMIQRNTALGLAVRRAEDLDPLLMGPMNGWFERRSWLRPRRTTTEWPRS